MERIMNEDNDWEHDVKGDTVRGPQDYVCRDEVVQT